MPVLITSASVKVMRSFDYCHFEVAMSISLEGVDDTRKEAARLADKAVEQYKAAKTHAEKVERLNSQDWKIRDIRSIAESDRTPEQKAKLKAYEDACFKANQSHYDYEDDWSDTVNDDWEDEDEDY